MYQENVFCWSSLQDVLALGVQKLQWENIHHSAAVELHQMWHHTASANPTKQNHPTPLQTLKLTPFMFCWVSLLQNVEDDDLSPGSYGVHTMFCTFPSTGSTWLVRNMKYCKFVISGSVFMGRRRQETRGQQFFLLGIFNQVSNYVLMNQLCFIRDHITNG